MRAVPAIVLLFALVVSPQAQSGPNDAIVRAEAELTRMRALVEAGAMPRASLDKAEQDLADAKDEVILAETLYGKASVDDLTNDQAAEMVRAAERQIGRQQERIEALRTRVEEGVAPRTELTPLLEELDRRRRTLDLAQSRVRLLEELAKIIQAEGEEDEASRGDTRIAEKFLGNGRFNMADFRRVNSAFEERFGRPLPVSAMGMTALHRSLGFDHTGRVDVALSPDQAEGRWLKDYLEGNAIPHFAFRAAVPGKATGAHFHLGPPSLRLRTYAKSPARSVAD